MVQKIFFNLGLEKKLFIFFFRNLHVFSPSSIFITLIHLELILVCKVKCELEFFFCLLNTIWLINFLNIIILFVSLRGQNTHTHTHTSLLLIKALISSDQEHPTLMPSSNPICHPQNCTCKDVHCISIF